jgi:hypothetical protein
MAKKTLNKSYKRQPASREPYDYVLIVCEGSKSEPNYLKKLRNSYRLSNANIEITPADGSDPMSIVVFGKEKAEIAIKAGLPYDRIYFVFDRDAHQNYNEAIQFINNLNDYGKLFAITSWPCFEIWVLLHFVDTTSPFDKVGKRSACDMVIQKIKDSYSNYQKGDPNLYDVLKEKMESAIKHAKRLEKHNKETASKNPSTKMHHLIEYLINLKQ